MLLGLGATITWTQARASQENSQGQHRVRVDFPDCSSQGSAEGAKESAPPGSPGWTKHGQRTHDSRKYPPQHIHTHTHILEESEIMQWPIEIHLFSDGSRQDKKEKSEVSYP